MKDQGTRFNFFMTLVIIGFVSVLTFLGAVTLSLIDSGWSAHTIVAIVASGTAIICGLWIWSLVLPGED